MGEQEVSHNLETLLDAPTEAQDVRPKFKTWETGDLEILADLRMRELGICQKWKTRPTTEKAERKRATFNNKKVSKRERKEACGYHHAKQGRWFRKSYAAT